MESFLRRERLRRMRRNVIRAGTYFKPELSLYEGGGDRFVVKDCSAMHPLLKGAVGRRTQRRETAIYGRLEGVKGIPAFRGVIDIDAFAVEYIEGETLSRGLAPDRLRRALLDLESIIEAIHSRRVVHLDLKQKRNVLVRPDDTVAVVDFQSALSLESALSSRLLFPWLKGRDRAGLVKFKGKYAPDLLSAEERRIFRRELVLARFWPFTQMVRALRKIFKYETNAS